MTQPFLLEQYFFPHVSVAADPRFNPGTGVLPPAFSVKTSVQKDAQADVYQVAVEVKLAAEDEEKRQPYAIELVGIGLFRVAPSLPDPEKILRINGSSIIYSAAREFLITVTARGPWGAIMLPTISFFDDKEGEAEKPPTKGGSSQKLKAKKKTNKEK